MSERMARLPLGLPVRWFHALRVMFGARPQADFDA